MSVKKQAWDLHRLQISVPEQVLCQDLGGESVILDLANGNYFGLNELGSRIWALLSEGQSVAEIVHILLKGYDVTAEVLRKDLLDFLADLEQHGLIRVEHGQAQ